ncbi:hypothetical protein DL769_009569 [Monosporascus sp. CRB-8-3]|nr:hypothetical protein DL769_009569 [Monosporascus sp. CRB-8-3]
MPVSEFEAQSPGRILNGTVISTIEASQALDDNGVITTRPIEPGSSEQTDTKGGELARRPLSRRFGVTEQLCLEPLELPITEDCEALRDNIPQQRALLLQPFEL